MGSEGVVSGDSLLKRRGETVEAEGGKRLLFVATEGDLAPSYKVRAKSYANGLRRLGWSCEFLSVHDDYLKRKGNFRKLTDKEKAELIEAMAVEIAARKPDLVYSQKAFFHVAAVLKAWKESRIPYVLDYDDYDLNCPELFSARSPLFKRYFSSSDPEEVTKEAALNARLCIVANSVLATLFKGWGVKSPLLLETVADPERFPYFERPLDRKSVRFVWTGFIWGPQMLPSIHIMMDGLRRLHRRFPQVELHLVGRGMESCVDRMLEIDFPGLPVKRTHWCPDEMVPLILKESDVGVFPMSIPEERFTWATCKSPTKMFEYLSTGLPVMASRIGDTCRLLSGAPKAGFLFDTPEEFEEKGAPLVESPALRREMGRAAKSLVESRCCIEKVAELLSSALERIVSRAEANGGEAI